MIPNVKQFYANLFLTIYLCVEEVGRVANKADHPEVQTAILPASVGAAPPAIAQGVPQMQEPKMEPELTPFTASRATLQGSGIDIHYDLSDLDEKRQKLFHLLVLPGLKRFESLLQDIDDDHVAKTLKREEGKFKK